MAAGPVLAARSSAQHSKDLQKHLRGQNRFGEVAGPFLSFLKDFSTTTTFVMPASASSGPGQGVDPGTLLHGGSLALMRKGKSTLFLRLFVFPLRMPVLLGLLSSSVSPVLPVLLGVLCLTQCRFKKTFKRTLGSPILKQMPHHQSTLRR